MPRVRLILCSATSAMFIALTAPITLPAATIYMTVLAGGNEVPSSGSPATGTSIVTLNGNLLSVNETYSGLVGGAAAAAHIHCCSSIGVNAPVAVPFIGFPATTSGTYMQTFDSTLASTYTAAFVTASGGTAALAEAALIAGLNNGQTYANIHDAVYPGGEIRGQLAAVPEPTTAGLLLLGLAPLLMMARKARRR